RSLRSTSFPYTTLFRSLELEQRCQHSDAQRRELQSCLQQRENEWSAIQAQALERDKMFETKIDELQIQLREKQLLAESRAAEIRSEEHTSELQSREKLV